MVCASGDAEAHRQLYVAAPRKVRRGWIKVHGWSSRYTQAVAGLGPTALSLMDQRQVS